MTVPSNASTLNLASLPVAATVTIASNANNATVTGPTQNFTSHHSPECELYANLVVNGGSASNTNIVSSDFTGGLTLNPAGTDNTFIALNNQSAAAARRPAAPPAARSS